MDDNSDICASGAVQSWINFTDADGSEASLLLYGDSDVIFITVIMPILMIAGVALNSSLIFVIVRVPRMRNVTNFYLAQLAFADLSFLTVFVGGQMFSYFASPVKLDVSPSGRASCVPTHFFTDFLHVATCCLVTVVSLEKCNAICKPLWYTVKRGRARCVRLTLLAWLFSAGVATVPAFTFRVYTPTCVRWPNSTAFADLPELIATCQPTTQESTFGYGMMDFSLFLTFFVFNIRLYVRIVRALHHRVLDRAGVQNAALRSRVKTRNQVAMMLVVNGSILFGLMAPHRLYSVITDVMSFTMREVNEIEHLITTMTIVRQVFYFLLLLNSVVNPIIFNVVSAQYRKAFSKTFRCQLKRKPRAVTPVRAVNAWSPF